MGLPAGTRLNGYEIVSLVGAGGPPSLATALASRELRRGLAGAQERTWP